MVVAENIGGDHLMCSSILRKIGIGLLTLFLIVQNGFGQDGILNNRVENVIGNLQDVGKFLFKLADTNNDNHVSQAEAVDAGNLIAGAFFFRADTNGDGVVTPDESNAAREALFNQKPLLRFIFQRGQEAVNEPGNNDAIKQSKTDLMNVLDANHDNNVSAMELRQAIQTAVQSLFLTADHDGDGQLDPTEANEAVADISRTVVQAAFNATDLDKNGAVSQAEFDKAIVTPGHTIFKIFDANNDGQISSDEMRSGLQILGRELHKTQVPEAPNSLRNRAKQPAQAPAQEPVQAPVQAPAQEPVQAPAQAPPQQ